MTKRVTATLLPYLQEVSRDQRLICLFGTVIIVSGDKTIISGQQRLIRSAYVVDNNITIPFHEYWLHFVIIIDFVFLDLTSYHSVLPPVVNV